MAAKKIIIKKDNGGGDDDKTATTTASLTNKNRQDWNDYIVWLRQRGLAGNPILDKGGYGIQMLQNYIKQNPNTSLTTDMVKPIQADFSNYRNYALDQVQKGKATLQAGTTPETFMSELSKLDNYGGSLTTKHLFPKEYLTYIENNKPIQTVDKGFATTQK